MQPLEIDPLALRYGNYCLKFEQASARVRDLPNCQEIYDRATEDWVAHGPRQPPSPDPKMVNEYLDILDAICNRENPTYEESIQAVHAAGGAMIWMQDHVFSGIPRKRAQQLMRQGDDYATNIVFNIPEMPMVDTGAVGIPFSVEDIEQLLNQPLRYSQADGTIVECTVVDFGTSSRFGEFYTVVDEDGEEIPYSRDAMQEILDKRV